MSARIGGATVVLVLVVSSAAAGWWAATTAMEPPELPQVDTDTVWYTVADGAVGRAVAVPVLASWTATGEVYAPASGVLTEQLVPSGRPVEAGTVVATVDLKPVVVAAGDVPAFRDLRGGVAGQDVAQLQELLATLGFLDPDGIDGSFGPATTRAVRAWQEHLGIARDGSVPLGQVLFVQELPLRVRWAVEVGQQVQAGQPLGAILTAVPTLVAEIGRRALADLPLDAEVVVTGGSGVRWLGRIGGVVEEGPEGSTVEVVLHSDGCDEHCDGIPVDGVTRLSGRAVLTEERHGPVVPASAVIISAAGQHSVLVEGRGWVAVEVLAEADGQVVLHGIEAGDRVQLPPPEHP